MADEKPPSPETLEALRRDAIAALDSAAENLRKGASGLSDVIRYLPDSPVKGRLRQRLHEAQRQMDASFPYSSQAGQDRYLDEQVFQRKRNGVFVEVGAYDGVSGSNGLFFERFRGWRGLLIEPSPRLAALARTRRALPVLEVAAGPERRRARFLDIRKGYTQMGGLVEHYDAEIRARVEADPRFDGDEIDVEMRPLADILAEHGMRRVDYISLDVEGAEEGVLKHFPFEQFDVRAWSVENNTGSNAVAQILSGAGYRLSAHIGVDEIWVKPT